MKKTIWIILLVLATLCFVTDIVLVTTNPYDEVKRLLMNLEYVGLAMLFAAIILRRTDKTQHSTPPSNPEFTANYPATARGIFKRFLFWISLFCSLTAIALIIICPYDKVRGIAMPILWVGIITSWIHILLVRQDKKRNANNIS